MPVDLPSDSVGIVTPEYHDFEAPLPLVCGATLPRFRLAVETYGRLNAEDRKSVV